MLSFKPTFSLSSFTFIKKFFSSSSLSAIRVVYLRLLVFLPAILIPVCVSSSPARSEERVRSRLTKKQESPEHKEISHLNDQWLDLCLQSNNLCLQREEDLQRTRDYHDRMNVVEGFLEKFTTEWDNLAR